MTPMTRIFGVGLLAVLASCAAAAQAPSKLEFDVASLKQNKSGLPPAGGDQPRSNFPLGPGATYSPTGGVFSATNLPLGIYIMFAYKMTDHEWMSLRKQLPSWALEEFYDVEARTDRHDASKDEMRLMMQALLADRVKLAVHTTTEDIPVYALVLTRPEKPAPKLQVHPVDDTSCAQGYAPVPDRDTPFAAKPPSTVAGGFPVICGGAATVPPSVPGRLAVGYRDVPISLIAVQLTGIGGLDRPVIDKTGLEGKYDFLLEFSRDLEPGEVAPPNYTPGPGFRQALTEQTGLKLMPQKAPVENIIVDHIERPSAN